ncbi:uncharacterized protein LOC131001923 [Salvia miltiorrhiza]|uniref:uncharacterized protein LOC131001923 n=1 Tax=Salvia miltiorrhiza TaxID=226208 RepID=UPI0025AC2061|nr:uncharacterized protein LOC131001923 [Salvia miltiorrhiza]XP_057784556.1 uncharacterized protein LOC131001923 [Salvia miltiorrhiza]
MPSVGMRRSTRVFGTRVLRSGRKLWTEPQEGGKNVRATYGENKFQELLDNTADGGGDIDGRRRKLWQEDETSASLDMSAEPKMEERETGGVEEKNVDRRCGIVYKRKRKRAELTAADLVEDGRFAKKYVRKQWRKRCRASESFGACGGIRDSVRTRELAIVVNESSYDCYYWITCFLTSLLSYMARARIGMRQLSAFMLSKPMSDAYSSCGMLFLQDPITAVKPCVCIVTGSRSTMPLFSVNIFAIPPFFVHIQTSVFLRSAHLDCLLVRQCENDEELINVDDDAEEPSFQIPSLRDQPDCAHEASEMSTGSEISFHNVAVSDNDTSGGKQLGQSAAGFPKSALRNLQLRNSRSIQKRRSSLRRKRGRPPSAFRAQKGKGALASELFRIRHDGSQFLAASPSRVHRSPDKRRLTTNIRELKSAMGATTQDVCASSCSANLLITDTEKCYRVEGATIALETSASKQWLLSITKDGTKQCSLIAQKVMRPSSSNRFTHAVIWASDGSLKLEFPDKQDWLIFKELYKECSDRNMQTPAATSVIPVPGVQEVSIPNDQYIPFVRPESYITLKNDELIRALMKKTANYDMDSDDEEWLAKLNNELYVGKELQEFITSENFELVIDALEKYLHSNPDEHVDEQAACDFSMHLERKEVIEAIYKYWIRKRKQKRSALVRVFQLYQPRRSQVIPKSVLRKKRSFKRQASQGGRGKQQPLLKAIAAERDALEQKNNVHKLQEAKAAANKYEGLATQKRHRAQMLMENADLATYKAMMALRIAEAAQVDEAPERVTSLFLG